MYSTPLSETLHLECVMRIPLAYPLEHCAESNLISNSKYDAIHAIAPDAFCGMQMPAQLVSFTPSDCSTSRMCEV